MWPNLCVTIKSVKCFAFALFRKDLRVSFVGLFESADTNANVSRGAPLEGVEMPLFAPLVARVAGNIVGRVVAPVVAIEHMTRKD